MALLLPVKTDAAPAAIGPYSQAIVLGELVFCSGQVALDPITGNLADGDAAAQTRLALANVVAVLTAAGSSLERVVKTTVFLTSMEDFGSMNAVYAEIFGDHRPARSTVEVSRLPKNARVEIEVIASR